MKAMILGAAILAGAYSDCASSQTLRRATYDGQRVCGHGKIVDLRIGRDYGLTWLGVRTQYLPWQGAGGAEYFPEFLASYYPATPVFVTILTRGKSEQDTQEFGRMLALLMSAQTIDLPVRLLARAKDGNCWGTPDSFDLQVCNVGECYY